MDVRYDFEPVEVTALAGQSSRQLYLITAWSKTSNRPMHLLTNREVKSLAQALLIIIGYLSRWSVEETYRFYKTGQGLETMRLMTLGGLKNMLHASFIVASILARMSNHTSWRQVAARVALRIRKAPDKFYNWLYRFSDAISVIMRQHLAQLRRHNRPILSTRRSGPIQQELFPTGIDL